MPRLIIFAKGKAGVRSHDLSDEAFPPPGSTEDIYSRSNEGAELEAPPSRGVFWSYLVAKTEVLGRECPSAYL